MKRAASSFVALSTVATLVLLARTGPASAQNVTFEQPILLTSAGQSAEVVIAGAIFKKAALQPKVAAQAKASEVAGHKTLVLVPGFSSKGLGSAGINRDQELERVRAVIAAAQQAGTKILVLHLGGKARRGAQSDEFNRLAVSAAHQIMVVKAGDEDQFFTRLAAERKIPIVQVDRMADLTEPLAKSFR